MEFSAAVPRSILFGVGRAAECGRAASALGARPLLATGSDPARAQAVRASLRAAGIPPAAEFAVSGEPTLAVAESIARAARDARCDLVVSVGGGSVLDAGKAAAALAPNDGPPRRYIEVVGEGRPLERAPLPHIAVPTTSGTGAEATRNAVLGAPEEGVKASLRDPRLVPAVALVDPELAAGAPPAVAAAAGLDALAQLLEAFTSCRANPFTDGFCREGLARAGRSLRASVLAPSAAARADMALAALFSGIALANAGLGAVHGFAGPLGGMTGAPHGALCAALLAPVTRANLAALEGRQPKSDALARYDEAARLLTGGAIQRGGLADWLGQLATDLGVPGLRALGVDPSRRAEAVQKALRASSMKGNPVALDEAELAAILVAAE